MNKMIPDPDIEELYYRFYTMKNKESIFERSRDNRPPEVRRTESFSCNGAFGLMKSDNINYERIAEICQDCSQPMSRDECLSSKCNNCAFHKRQELAKNNKKITSFFHSG